LDEVIESLKRRFAEGQEVVLRGIWLIPSYVVACENWEESIDPFIQHYSDELPNMHTVKAELSTWKILWTDAWENKWKIIQDQHNKSNRKRNKIDFCRSKEAQIYFITK